MSKNEDILSRIHWLIMMASDDGAKREYRSGIDNLKRGHLLPNNQLSILDYERIAPENRDTEERNSLANIKAQVIALRDTLEK